MRVSKDEAIRRLIDAGHSHAAKILSQWRNKNNTNWGWDGWFRGQFPNLINEVWR